MLVVSKYHGCGNDFLLTEDASYTIAQKKRLTQLLCERHTGIGADGMIFLHKHPLTMEIYNSDGSLAPMCGNGIRCFAKYAIDLKLMNQSDFEVHTASGIKQLHVHSLKPFYVSVNMGKAYYQENPMSINRTQLQNYPLSVKDRTFLITTVFMTTLHTVIFIDKEDDFSYAEYGKAIHKHSLFPDKTNVDFVQVIDRTHIHVATYERGVGMTLACGSGCCAAVWVAWTLGKVERKVSVHLNKGTLQIQINEDQQLIMSGSAVKIMSADVDIEPNESCYE